MTLDTRLRLLAPLPDEAFVIALHRKANEVMGLDIADVRFESKAARQETWGWREASINNEPGQGFPAWLMIDYKLGQEPIPALDPNDPDLDEDDRAYYAAQPNPYFAELSYDTGYSYQDEFGGCGSLHARLLAQVGTWLDDRGMPWAVQNEFSGEWYQGDQRYTGLMSLIEGGQEASAWFQNIVKPAIIQDAQQHGGNVEFN